MDENAPPYKPVFFRAPPHNFCVSSAVLQVQDSQFRHGVMVHFLSPALRSLFNAQPNILYPLPICSSGFAKKNLILLFAKMTRGALTSTESKPDTASRADRNPLICVPTLHFAPGI